MNKFIIPILSIFYLVYPFNACAESYRLEITMESNAHIAGDLDIKASGRITMDMNIEKAGGLDLEGKILSIKSDCHENGKKFIVIPIANGNCKWLSELSFRVVREMEGASCRMVKKIRFFYKGSCYSTRDFRRFDTNNVPEEIRKLAMLFRYIVFDYDDKPYIGKKMSLPMRKMEMKGSIYSSDMLPQNMYCTQQDSKRDGGRKWLWINSYTESSPWKSLEESVSSFTTGQNSLYDETPKSTIYSPQLLRSHSAGLNTDDSKEYFGTSHFNVKFDVNVQQSGN